MENRNRRNIDAELLRAAERFQEGKSTELDIGNKAFYLTKQVAEIIDNQVMKGEFTKKWKKVSVVLLRKPDVATMKTQIKPHLKNRKYKLPF